MAGYGLNRVVHAPLRHPEHEEALTLNEKGWVFALDRSILRPRVEKPVILRFDMLSPCKSWDPFHVITYISTK